MHRLQQSFDQWFESLTDKELEAMIKRLKKMELEQEKKRKWKIITTT